VKNAFPRFELWQIVIDSYSDLSFLLSVNKLQACEMRVHSLIKYIETWL